MYISLRESRKNGFKHWSDSQQPKCDRVWDAEEYCGAVVAGSAFAGPGLAVPASSSLFAAEKSL